MTPTEQIDQYIAGMTDWRGPVVARLRELILEVEPDLEEEWKWSSPVWSLNGLVCSVSGFTAHVSANFFQGASLQDPTGLFNTGRESKIMRTIKLKQGETIDESAFKDLVRAAVAHNAGQ